MKRNLNRTALPLLLVPFLLIAGGCRRNLAIQAGSEVKLNYTLKVEGKTIDASQTGQPLTFVIGSRQLIPGLEEQLMGLHKGDKRSLVIPPEKAYGAVRADAIQKIPKKNFGAIKDLKPGMTVTARGNGSVIQAKVIEITKDTVSLDLNHPLAGKTLNFDVEVVSVEVPKKST